MTPPVTLPQSLAFWLMAGAFLGPFARAYLVKNQNPFSRETYQDQVIMIGFAVAWVYPLPLLQAIYPPFAWPPQWPNWVPGIFFFVFSYLFVEMAKTALLNYAPKAFAKYTGQELPKDPPTPTKGTTP